MVCINELLNISSHIKELQFFKMDVFTDRLPFSIRVLLESAIRNCDNFQVKKSDVEKISDWEHNQALEEGTEVAFKPARVILQVNSFIKDNFYVFMILFVT